jgi:CRP-like cAMP-binding protein
MPEDHRGIGEIVELFKETATKRVVKKHTVLLYQGEIPRQTYIILKGVVKSYSLTEGGEELITQLYAENSFLPIPWLFGKATHTLYYHETLTDCTVLNVDKQAFYDTILSSPRAMQIMLDYFATSYTSSLVHITALEQPRAREKILYTLYYLCLMHGNEFKPGKYKIELHLTHSVIAALSGLTRETTALELSKLKKIGLVKYNTRYYLVDKLAVEKQLGEDNLSTLKLR